MAIKFNLIMKNGVKVKSIKELQDNFDLETVVSYFADGRLINWLNALYYEDEAKALSQIDKNDPKLSKKICDIFNVTYENEEVDIVSISKRNQRISRLKQYTEDKKIIDNIDCVAFDQVELANLYDSDAKIIYLCAGEFTIPESKSNITYIEIGNPKINKRFSNNINNEKKRKYEDKLYDIKTVIRDEDIISEEVADLIGTNQYVILDDYIVFKSDHDYFRSKKELLENGEDLKRKFYLWDIKRCKLSSFDIPGFDEYRYIVGSTNNKLIVGKLGFELSNYLEDLCKPYPETLLFYDVDTKEGMIEIDDWCGVEATCKSYGEFIAYVDCNNILKIYNCNNKQVKIIDSKSYVKENLNMYNRILTYFGEKNLYIYDLSNGKSICKRFGDGQILNTILTKENIYILRSDPVKIVKYNFYKDEYIEIYNSGYNRLKTRMVSNSKYISIIIENFSFPVFSLIVDKDLVKKITDKCGYTSEDVHWFKDTDYYHHSFESWQVGKYFYYCNKEHKYYRINALTGEKYEVFINREG